MADSCVIGERSEATGLVDLRATAIVCNESIKNPSEFLGNMYKDSLNSLWSKAKNLVAGDGASTASCTGTGSGVPVLLLTRQELTPFGSWEVHCLQQ